MTTNKFIHPQIKSTWPRCKKCGDAYFDHVWQYLEDGTRVCKLCNDDRWWERQ